LVVKSAVARAQIDADSAAAAATGGRYAPGAGGGTGAPGGGAGAAAGARGGGLFPPPLSAKPKRFHGTATLDSARVGRDASRIADEVVAHLAGLVGAEVTVTIEIDAL